MRSDPHKLRPTAARRIGFEILLRVEKQASYAADLLNSPLTADLSKRDAAFCKELVMGTLRWQATLDFIAHHWVRRSWSTLEPEVRLALRMGLYQLRFLTRVPARAALYETVELVKAAGKRSAAGLVNAVLRREAKNLESDTAKNSGRDSANVSNRSSSPKPSRSPKPASHDRDRLSRKDAANFSIQQDGVSFELPHRLASLRPPSMPDLDWLSVVYSHPPWMLDRWITRYGRPQALAFALANNQVPTTFLRLNPARQAYSELEEQLRRQHIQLRAGTFLLQSREVVDGNISRTAAFRRGEIVIQDEASQIVPHMLDVQEGHRVLDLCAAPGNKAAQLASWAGPSGVVVACDLHFHRLAKVGALPLRRVVLDGTEPLPFRMMFDRILVDAPCSGTGTLRRHPEIKWRLSLTDIQSLAEKQLQLLNNAAAALSWDGRMVYSTCSLEQEENESVVETFLAAHPEFRLLPLRADAKRLWPFFHPSSRWILEEEFLVTSPARDGTDGFFAAIFVK